MSTPLFDSDIRVEKTIPPGLLKNISQVTVPSNEPWLKDSQGYLYQLQHGAKGVYETYDLSFDPKTSPPGTTFTNAQIIDFDFNNSPSYYLIDNDAIWLEINVSNTSGTNTVTPTFAELMFDPDKAFEWLMNGVSFYQVPAIQVLLEPALELPNTQYVNLASVANHDASLAYNSAAKAAIAANGSAQYIVRIPNPFPDEGFWFGALGGNRLTLRCNTPSGGAVDSGTGTLNCVSLKIHCTCLAIPQEAYAALYGLWNERKWRATEIVRNLPISITLVASGDSPYVQLTQLRDEQIIFALSIIRASRALAGTAQLDTTALPATGKVRIQSKDGTIISSSAYLPYQYLKNVLSLRHFGSSNCIQNLNLIPHFYDPNAMQAIHKEETNGCFLFTGDENLILSDTGSTATVYVDTIAWSERTYGIKNGMITRLGKF